MDSKPTLRGSRQQPEAPSNVAVVTEERLAKRCLDFDYLEIAIGGSSQTVWRESCGRLLKTAAVSVTDRVTIRTETVARDTTGRAMHVSR